MPSLSEYVQPMSALVAILVRRARPVPRSRPRMPRAWVSDLTPLGADKAGNAAGTIPAWDGGLTPPRRRAFPRSRAAVARPDPVCRRPAALQVDATNMAKYADVLTEGHKALLKQYSGTLFPQRLPDPPLRRRPAADYDGTKRVATTATLATGGNGVLGAIGGVPFPIPKQGVEVFWNHVLRYHGDIAKREFGQAAISPNGTAEMVKFHDEFYVNYYQPGMTEADMHNVILYYIQETVGPGAPRRRDPAPYTETLDQTKENRLAWIYNAGQRRVRRAPDVAFDNPGTAADNLRTSDQLDIYNGSPERYDWKLIGKKEILLPYNAYKLHPAKARPWRGDQAPAHEPGPACATNCTGSGWSTRCSSPASATCTSGARSTSTRLLADPRRRLLRQPRPAVPLSGRPWH